MENAEMELMSSLMGQSLMVKEGRSVEEIELVANHGRRLEKVVESWRNTVTQVRRLCKQRVRMDSDQKFQEMPLSRSDIENMPLTSKTGSEGNVSSIAKISFKVPSGLPKFGSATGEKDPQEFWDSFAKVMVANEVPVEKYVTILPLCLDSIDTKWLDRWTLENGEDLDHRKLHRDFISHFQHPNSKVIWQNQIEKLHVDTSGVQKYSDRFIGLAHKLDWDLEDSMTIYRYKNGLPAWIVDQLSSAEASSAIADGGNKVIGVDGLAKMVLIIEANRSMQTGKSTSVHGHSGEKISSGFRSGKSYGMACFNCGIVGHKMVDCRKEGGGQYIAKKDGSSFGTSGTT
ncbi:MAG: C2HC-type zinc finger protein, partial [Nitrosotalea sp.]